MAAARFPTMSAPTHALSTPEIPAGPIQHALGEDTSLQLRQDTVLHPQAQHRFYIGATRDDVRRLYGLDLDTFGAGANTELLRSQISAVLPYIRRGDEPGLYEHLKQSMPVGATEMSEKDETTYRRARLLGVAALAPAMIWTVWPMYTDAEFTLMPMMATLGLMAVIMAVWDTLKKRGTERTTQAYLDDATATLEDLSTTTTLVDITQAPALAYTQQVLLSLEIAVDQDRVSIEPATTAEIDALWRDWQELTSTITTLPDTVSDETRTQHDGAIEMVATALSHRGAQLYQQVRSQQEIVADAAIQAHTEVAEITSSVAVDSLKQLAAKNDTDQQALKPINTEQPTTGRSTQS